MKRSLKVNSDRLLDKHFWNTKIFLYFKNGLVWFNIEVLKTCRSLHCIFSFHFMLFSCNGVCFRQFIFNHTLDGIDESSFKYVFEVRFLKYVFIAIAISARSQSAHSFWAILIVPPIVCELSSSIQPWWLGGRALV